MKIGVLVVGMVVVSASAGTALAQERGAPPAHRGFQMDLRTGYSIPMGNLVAGHKQSDELSGQVPVILDIGGKPIPELFLGGYLGLAFGGPGTAGKGTCDQGGVDCSALSLHLGFLIQYHILPAALANPWVGYGVGVESLAETISVGGNSRTATYTGFEFARLMGGVDFRVSDVIGIGPFVDLSIAEYSRYKVDGSNGSDGDIPDTGTHEWLTLGVRGVLFP